MSDENSSPELTEDIEVIGPGQMLADARKQQKLSIEDVAKQLNFRVTLVKELEAENFDAKVPVTFTRGYLRNYAKLVHVPVDEVLASFEMLGVAKTQGAEMQSFSKQTSKQAENNAVVYIGYLIVIILIALTIMWWYQESNNKDVEEVPAPIVSEIPAPAESQEALSEVEQASLQSSDQQAALDELVNDIVNVEETSAAISSLLDENSDVAQPQPQQSPAESLLQATLIFTFAGDCWVNIYDSTGERIAWGIKKEQYVMTISGVPPFSITLGKPELVSITYDEQPVDMSGFPAGHIAKFELPLNE